MADQQQQPPPNIRATIAQYVQIMSALNDFTNASLLHMQIMAIIPCAAHVARHAANPNPHNPPHALFNQENLDTCLDEFVRQYEESLGDDFRDNFGMDEEGEGEGEADEAMENGIDDVEDDTLVHVPDVPNQAVLPAPPPATPAAAVPPASATAAVLSTPRHSTTGCVYLDNALELPVAQFKREFGITQETFDYVVDRIHSVPTFRHTGRKHQRTVPVQLATHLLRRNGHSTRLVAVKLGISEGSVVLYRKRILAAAQELGVDLNEILLHHQP